MTQRIAFLKNCKSKITAKKLAPWACAWLATDGGFVAFQSTGSAYSWVQNSGPKHSWLVANNAEFA